MDEMELYVNVLGLGMVLHIAMLHYTEWYNLSNTYIVSSDTGLVDIAEHSIYIYICIYYSNKQVHCYNASIHISDV